MLTHRQDPVVPSRVVVLGSRGFVGRHIVEHLASAAIPVEAIASTAIDLCEPTAVDLLRQCLRPDDVLVFVSALTPDRGRDARTLMRNVAMAAHTVTALQQQPVAHVVYLGSDAVYADDANPVNEASVQSPSSMHGIMHFTRERILRDALSASSTPLLLLRPTLLYGPGDTHNGYGPNRFLRTARADRKIALFGEGAEQRDHVFVKDLARLVVLAVRHRSEGALNVASGISTSFADVAALVAATGEGVVIEKAPRGPGPVTHRHFDITAHIKAWPSFQYTPLAEGLRQS
jgi:nucleoside-diphosphate-sugar epimerase